MIDQPVSKTTQFQIKPNNTQEQQRIQPSYDQFNTTSKCTKQITRKYQLSLSNEFNGITDTTDSPSNQIDFDQITNTASKSRNINIRHRANTKLNR